jgi:hypothetical protein
VRALKNEFSLDERRVLEVCLDNGGAANEYQLFERAGFGSEESFKWFVLPTVARLVMNGVLKWEPESDGERYRVSKVKDAMVVVADDWVIRLRLLRQGLSWWM